MSSTKSAAAIDKCDSSFYPVTTSGEFNPGIQVPEAVLFTGNYTELIGPALKQNDPGVKSQDTWKQVGGGRSAGWLAETRLLW